MIGFRWFEWNRSYAEQIRQHYKEYQKETNENDEEDEDFSVDIFEEKEDKKED